MKMMKIIWPTNIPIDKLSLIARTKFVESNMRGLLPVYKDEYAILESYATEHHIKVGQLLSIRNQLKIQKEIKKTNRVDLYANKIIEAYNKLITDPNLNLTDINSFYVKTNLPITPILRLLNKQDTFKRLDHRILKKFYQVMKDFTKIETKSKEQSRKFEIRVEKFISDFGVPFQTEETIRYAKTYTLTPDILFDSDVIIEVGGIEHRVKWLDAKNYIFMGHMTPFILESLKKQADKYGKMFGPGAFVFRYGFVADISIDHVLLLDGSNLLGKKIEKKSH